MSTQLMDVWRKIGERKIYPSKQNENSIYKAGLSMPYAEIGRTLRELLSRGCVRVSTVAPKCLTQVVAPPAVDPDSFQPLRPLIVPLEEVKWKALAKAHKAGVLSYSMVRETLNGGNALNSIRRYLAEKRMTAVEAADYLHVSETEMSMMQNSAMPIPKSIRLSMCAMLGITEAQLMTPMTDDVKKEVVEKVKKQKEVKKKEKNRATERQTRETFNRLKNYRGQVKVTLMAEELGITPKSVRDRLKYIPELENFKGTVKYVGDPDDESMYEEDFLD